LLREYYTQRASAGLILTEGIAPSPNALGYARIPGLFSTEQTEAWRPVTQSVHSAGGRIIAQLMHTGRIGHARNLPPGARVVAPSAVRADGTMWTDAEGLQPMPTPEAMSADDLRETRTELVRAASNAIAAGFDGIELHGANGYLLEQFLHPHTNRRGDAYGGSVENRARFVTEAAIACAEAIGGDRVGIRLSPFNTYNDLPEHDDVHAQYTTLASSLRGLLYVHLVTQPSSAFEVTAQAIREAFGGPVIHNGGFDRERAETTISGGSAELVSFGRPYIANPDLVERMKRGADLAAPEPSTFYTPGAQGYVDYPPL
jgi:N-ethylmaleimide reductase